MGKARTSARLAVVGSCNHRGKLFLHFVFLRKIWARITTHMHFYIRVSIQKIYNFCHGFELTIVRCEVEGKDVLRQINHSRPLISASKSHYFWFLIPFFTHTSQCLGDEEISFVLNLTVSENRHHIPNVLSWPRPRPGHCTEMVVFKIVGLEGCPIPLYLHTVQHKQWRSILNERWIASQMWQSACILRDVYTSLNDLFEPHISTFSFADLQVARHQGTAGAVLSFVPVFKQFWRLNILYKKKTVNTR